MIKPITARVQAATQAGLLVTEPILNVGPAGVDGEVATRKFPSPSNAKSK
jgi:hypothetical protein